MCTKTDIETKIGQLTSKMTQIVSNSQCSRIRDFSNSAYEVPHLHSPGYAQHNGIFKPFPGILKRHKEESLGKCKTNLGLKFQVKGYCWWAAMRHKI